MRITRTVFTLCALCLVPAFGITDETHIEWKQLPKRPIAVGGQFAGISNGALLAAGGGAFPTPLFEGGKKVWVDSIFVLEPDASEWKPAGALSRPLAYGASVSDQKGLILIGGGDAETHYTSVTRLIWKDGTIEHQSLPDLPQPCAFQAAALIGSTLYVAGGQSSPKTSEALHTFWRLDLKQPQEGWRSLEAWPGPGRILPVAGTSGNDFYLFSGCELYSDQNGETKRRYLTDAYRYRPGNGWERLPDLPRPATGAPTPALTANDQIMIFSGDSGEYADRVWELKDKHPGFDRDIISFDLKTNQWRRAGGVPFSLATTPSVQWRGCYIIPGGEDRPGHRTPVVYSGKISPEHP